MKNKVFIFATSKQRTNFLTLVSVVFFIATWTAAKAENHGYHSNSYYTTRSVIVLCKTEKGSLSSFLNTYNFSFMQRTMENASKMNNSILASTLVHETDENLYLYSLRKAFLEFIQEEVKGYCSTELRLQEKIEAARKLFPEAKKQLSRS